MRNDASDTRPDSMSSSSNAASLHLSPNAIHTHIMSQPLLSNQQRTYIRLNWWARGHIRCFVEEISVASLSIAYRFHRLWAHHDFCCTMCVNTSARGPGFTASTRAIHDPFAPHVCSTVCATSIWADGGCTVSVWNWGSHASIRGDEFAVSLRAMLREQVWTEEIVWETCVQTRMRAWNNWYWDLWVDVSMHMHSRAMWCLSTGQQVHSSLRWSMSVRVHACIRLDGREHDSVLLPISTTPWPFWADIHRLRDC